MVLVRRIHNRGANIVVEAHAEVLFAPTGDVGRWTNRFSQRVRSFSSMEAPVNKRPRWGHYGKPLKTTFTASTTYQPVRMRVYSAVGSTSPHAWYVDQGTGIYAGNSPYEAKVLPPWTPGSPSLYEHTWRPGGPPNPKVSPVMIRGQKGQGFFDKGLKRGFQSMRMRSFQVPGDAKITEAMNSIPTGLLNFLGNTPADVAFMASLTEWRSWRDAAFNSGRVLGRNQGMGTREAQRRAIARGLRQQARLQSQAFRKARRAQASKIRSQKRRDEIKAKGTSKPKRDKNKTKTNALQKAQAAAARERAAWLMKHPQWRSTGANPQGFYVVNAKGEKAFHVWSIKVADLFLSAGIKAGALPAGVKTV